MTCTVPRTAILCLLFPLAFNAVLSCDSQPVGSNEYDLRPIARPNQSIFPFQTLEHATLIDQEYVRSTAQADAISEEQPHVYDLATLLAELNQAVDDISGLYTVICSGVHFVALYNVHTASWDTLSHQPPPANGICTQEISIRNFSLAAAGRNPNDYIDDQKILRTIGLSSIRLHSVSLYYGFSLQGYGTGLVVDERGVHTIEYERESWGIRSYSRSGVSTNWLPSGVLRGVHYPTALTADSETFWVGDNLGTIYRLDRRTGEIDSLVAENSPPINAIAVHGDELFISTNLQAPNARLRAIGIAESFDQGAWVEKRPVTLLSLQPRALLHNDDGLTAVTDSELVTLSPSGTIASRIQLPVQSVDGVASENGFVWFKDSGLRGLPAADASEATRFVLP